MIWEETPYTILAAMAVGTLVLSAFYVWRRSHVPGVKAATLLMFLGAIYMGAYTVEITSSDLPLKIFGDRVQFAAVFIMPVIWLVYAFQLTGREKHAFPGRKGEITVRLCPFHIEFGEVT